MRKTFCLASIGLFLWLPGFAAGDGVEDLANALQKVADGMDAVTRGIDKGLAMADEEDRKAVAEEGARVVVDFSKYPAPFTLSAVSYEDANGDTQTASSYWDFEESLQERSKRSHLSMKGKPFMARSVTFTLKTPSTPEKQISVSIKKHREGRNLVIYVNPKVLPLSEQYQILAAQQNSRFFLGDDVRNRGWTEKWQGRIVGVNGERLTVRVTKSNDEGFIVGSTYVFVTEEIKPKLTVKTVWNVAKQIGE